MVIDQLEHPGTPESSEGLRLGWHFAQLGRVECNTKGAPHHNRKIPQVSAARPDPNKLPRRGIIHYLDI